MGRDAYSLAERLMGMTGEVWERHANPWSVWTRMLCLPLIALAIWSRIWLGGWAVLPLVAAMFWTWYNPRAFPAPKQWDSWSAKGTCGERVLIHHKEAVAQHHLRIANALSAASIIGLPPLAYGLWVFDIGWTIAGLALVILPKIWFVDRMVWVWHDWCASGKGRDDL